MSSRPSTRSSTPRSRTRLIEDLTQQVALKALPRLREGTTAPEIRGYNLRDARSVLATFWSARSRLPESELPENFWIQAGGQELLHLKRRPPG